MKRINLLPRELQPHQKTPQPTGRPRLTGVLLRRVAAVLIVIALASWQTVAIAWCEVQIQNFRRALDRAHLMGTSLKVQQQTLNVERADLQTRRAALETRYQVLAAAQQPLVPVSAVLADLVAALPAGVWITRLAVTGPTVRLTGTSQDAQAVAQVIERLNAAPRFRDTAFVSTERWTKGGGSGYVFDVVTAVLGQGDTAR